MARQAHDLGPRAGDEPREAALRTGSRSDEPGDDSSGQPLGALHGKRFSLSTRVRHIVNTDRERFPLPPRGRV